MGQVFPEIFHKEKGKKCDGTREKIIEKIMC